jgi:hypothetical protein
VELWFEGPELERWLCGEIEIWKGNDIVVCGFGVYKFGLLLDRG